MRYGFSSSTMLVRASDAVAESSLPQGRALEGTQRSQGRPRPFTTRILSPMPLHQTGHWAVTGSDQLLSSGDSGKLYLQVKGPLPTTTKARS